MTFFLGLPQLKIVHVDDWPIANASDNNEKNLIEESTFLVDLSQLKLLFHQCHYCGKTINGSSQNYKKFGSILYVSFYCSKCNKKRYWRSKASTKS